MAMTVDSMMNKIKTAPQGDADAFLRALCQGIIDEIQANAELVPVSTDQGTAGAGIITGKVM